MQVALADALVSVMLLLVLIFNQPTLKENQYAQVHHKHSSFLENSFIIMHFACHIAKTLSGRGKWPIVARSVCRAEQKMSSFRAQNPNPLI